MRQAPVAVLTGRCPKEAVNGHVKVPTRGHEKSPLLGVSQGFVW